LEILQGVINQIVTYTGSNTVDGSSNLTFNGTTLTVNGAANVNVVNTKTLEYDDNFTDSTGSGETCFKFGLGIGISGGDLVYLNSISIWQLADADLEATAGPVLLGIALGSSGTTNGVLLRGYVRFDSKFPTPTAGSAVYVGNTAGDMQTSAPVGSGDVVRIVGYGMGTGDAIWFCPDTSYVVLA
jgi:hypothetical protein